MRRFSQRSHLVTLSEINITPLLDLAFVLLIIFVITTPLLEQGLVLRLPQGGRADREPQREDVRTVEVHPTGYYQIPALGTNHLTLDQVQQALLQYQRANSNTLVYVRADRTTRFDYVFQLADICGNLGLTVSFRSEPRSQR